MLLTKTTVLPSGDHEAAPTCRVMYSFSIERLCWLCSTLALGLLAICLGSVMTFAACKVSAEANVLMITTIAKSVKGRIKIHAALAGCEKTLAALGSWK